MISPHSSGGNNNNNDQNKQTNTPLFTCILGAKQANKNFFISLATQKIVFLKKSSVD